MINGLIVYNSVDQRNNQWFIDECINKLNDNEYSLLYKEENEVLSYIESHKVDFVIYRSRDYKLVGGAGTVYSDSNYGSEYARIDDPDNGKPGYFTLKTN